MAARYWIKYSVNGKITEEVVSTTGGLMGAKAVIRARYAGQRLAFLAEKYLG